MASYTMGMHRLTFNKALWTLVATFSEKLSVEEIYDGMCYKIQNIAPIFLVEMLSA